MVRFIKQTIKYLDCTQMRITPAKNRSLRSRKRYLVLGGVLLVFLAGGVWYFYSKRQMDAPVLTTPNRGVGETDYSEPKKDEQSPKLDSGDETPKNLTPQQNVPASDPIAVSITHAGGSPLQVGVVINEMLSEGTCTLTLSRAGLADVTQSVTIFNGPSYTTCQGFTINNLQSGTWKLTISVKSGNRSGSVTKDVSL